MALHNNSIWFNVLIWLGAHSRLWSARRLRRRDSWKLPARISDGLNGAEKVATLISASLLFADRCKREDYVQGLSRVGQQSNGPNYARISNNKRDSHIADNNTLKEWSLKFTSGPICIHSKPETAVQGRLKQDHLYSGASDDRHVENVIFFERSLGRHYSGCTLSSERWHACRRLWIFDLRRRWGTFLGCSTERPVIVVRAIKALGTF